MPFQQVKVPAELIVTHKGVSVWRCYADDDFDYPEDYVFTTNPLGTDSEHPDSFDVRDLQVPSVLALRAYPDRAPELVSKAMIEAIEAGLIP